MKEAVSLAPVIRTKPNKCCSHEYISAKIMLEIVVRRCQLGLVRVIDLHTHATPNKDIQPLQPLRSIAILTAYFYYFRNISLLY